MKQKEKKVRPLFLLLPVLLLTIAGGWFLFTKYEAEVPGIRFESLPDAFGAKSELSLEIWDEKSGLKRVWIGLLKDGKETVLLEKEFPALGLLEGSAAKSDRLRVPIDPKKHGISDGKATLRLSVWDYSWRKWWHGNHHYMEKAVRIDTQPPGIDVISRTHNVRQGGSGLVIYRLSEDCPEQGVVVGDNFFPGHSGYFQDPQVYVSLFALSHLQGRDTRLTIRAVDAAGNSGMAGFPNFIRGKRFKKDKITISDSFLGWKMPELATDENLDGASLLDKFLFVNGKLRERNYQQTRQICRNTEKRFLWEGEFRRLPQAATRATYADIRDYYYKGKPVDQQRHLGIDLASVAHADVPAANNGQIVFAGSLGIYGKTVLIDHGIGLFSMYSHLSHIGVAVGDSVSRDQIIGNTGLTGLAGGDHLHFAMLVHNLFIDPIEWWDKNWIHNNIEDKLDLAAERFARAQ